MRRNRAGVVHQLVHWNLAGHCRSGHSVNDDGAYGKRMHHHAGKRAHTLSHTGDILVWRTNVMRNRIGFDGRISYQSLLSQNRELADTWTMRCFQFSRERFTELFVRRGALITWSTERGARLA